MRVFQMNYDMISTTIFHVGGCALDKQIKSCCAASRNLSKHKKNKGREQTILSSPSVRFSDHLVKIPAGSFLMGTEDKTGFPVDGEGPVREIEVSSFYMDRTAVTNEAFATFIQETAYITDAEQYGWSFVFHLFAPKQVREEAKRAMQTPWWLAVEGAKWDQPEGANSTIHDRLDHPVIHISWNDALAYCKWAGKRLPTEAEWEYAARGGLVQQKYAWGNELTPDGQHMCNIWQGDFPYKNTAEDGYIATAPAQSFLPNGYGLYNVAGNVWEWCYDWFSRQHDVTITKNPTGPDSGDAKVMRGGSYLCHRSYCNRYRVAARTANTMDSSTGNMGFRCVSNTI